MNQPASSSDQHGFVGAVSGLSLADIIQVKGSNRYSGSLFVEHTGNSGAIFFHDGDVVHAEQRDLSGEDAFYAIMEWVGGTFRSEPKVLTTLWTINQPTGFLILEAFRRIDETKTTTQQPNKTGSAREGAPMSDISTKLSVVPEVEHALVMTKDGSIVDDKSYQAELLSANALFLSQFSTQLGAQFGLGDLKSVIVHGNSHHLFLYDSKRHHLCVSAAGTANVNSLDSEIRKVLAQK